ncbi:fibroblast growth factor receptor 2-like isoform X7 [Apostichopus japonicus]|uniref:fibroblast growth factor receptor 2-like isoform X7 n=1 Tax=Stichopus japonicus TaxID=307972 RepID=UPI003AB4D3D2
MLFYTILCLYGLLGLTEGVSTSVQNITVVRGNSVFLNCSSKNNSSRKPIWWFQRKVFYADGLPPEMVDNVYGEVTNTTFSYLKITNFYSGNVGNYTCAFGDITIKTYMLDMKDPTITLLCNSEICPSFLDVNESTDQSFQCYSDQTPLQRKLTWKINDETPSSDKAKYKLIGLDIDVISTLNITIFKYGIFISCTLGNTSKSVSLQVNKWKSVETYGTKELLIVATSTSGALLVVIVLTVCMIAICKTRFNSWQYQINGQDHQQTTIEMPSRRNEEAIYEDTGIIYGDGGSFPSEEKDSASFHDYDLVVDTKHQLKDQVLERDMIHFISSLNTSKIILLWKGSVVLPQGSKKDVMISYVDANASDETKQLWQSCSTPKLSIPDHTNLLQTIGYCKHGGILYIVYDNFEMANLAQCLVSENTNYSSAAGTNSNDQKTAYAFDIIKGMEYLAKNECCHPGLRASRVYVNSFGFCKLYDFCLRRKVSKFLDLYIKKDADTKWILPPEVRSSSSTYQAASDVWAIGIILLEIFFGGLDSLRRSISQGEVNMLKKINALSQQCNYPDNMCSLMKSCLATKFEDRPTISSIKEIFDRITTAAKNKNDVQFNIEHYSG